MTKPIELSVPTNWDDALVSRYRGLPIADVYGSTGNDRVGGGRPGFLLNRVSRRRAEGHIRRVRDAGFSFTYLLNAPCLGNLEHQTGFRRDLDEHLRWIHGAGATSITVSIPLLVDIVKHVTPELRVKLSVIAHVDSVQKALHVERLGVDEVTLDYNINRELGLLAAIRGAVSMGLSLDVNDVCLFKCPFRTYCYNTTGHASQAGHASGGFIVDYCFFRCHRIKLSEPVELMKSPWIRPEDLDQYVERTGIRRFKVAGRTKETGQILRAVEAYARQRYDGNLLDILETTSRDTSSLDMHAARWMLARHPRLLGWGTRTLALAQRALPQEQRRPFVDILARVPAGARRPARSGRDGAAAAGAAAAGLLGERRGHRRGVRGRGRGSGAGADAPGRRDRGAVPRR